METFADILKRLRLDAGLSQRALAEKSGLTQQAIARWESGLRGDPAWSSVVALCRALEVSCERFMEERLPGTSSKKSRRKPNTSE